jgi:anthranilate 1,2-dioxygenase small subunit
MAENPRKIASLPVEAPTNDMVAALISDYAHALDDGQLDRWPGFFTETALYHVTTRENHDQGLPIGIIRCVGRGMMADRVKAFHTANIFEPHCYNHLLGPARISPGQPPGSIASRCNFQIVRIMEDGRMDLFATGKYLDEIVLDAGVAKLAQRIVVLDSRNVDILMVMPL